MALYLHQAQIRILLQEQKALEDQCKLIANLAAANSKGSAQIDLATLRDNRECISFLMNECIAFVLVYFESG